MTLSSELTTSMSDDESERLVVGWLLYSCLDLELKRRKAVETNSGYDVNRDLTRQCRQSLQCHDPNHPLVANDYVQ